MKEINSKQIIVSECLKCDPAYFVNVIGDDGANIEWVCTGLMIKDKKNPSNSHEKYNRIRFCYRRSDGKKIDIYELTEFETSAMVEALSAALTSSLRRIQVRILSDAT